jgi:hypothetical protein
MHRRSYLAAAASALTATTAGCLDALSSATTAHEQVGDEAWSDVQTDDTAISAGVGGTVELDAGEWTARSFWSEGAARLGVIVDDIDGTLDVYGIADEDFDTYQDGDDIDGLYLRSEGVSEPLEMQERVPSGEYWICLDNGEVYGTTGDEAVTANLAIGIF